MIFPTPGGCSPCSRFGSSWISSWVCTSRSSMDGARVVERKPQLADSILLSLNSYGGNAQATQAYPGSGCAPCRLEPESHFPPRKASPRNQRQAIAQRVFCHRLGIAGGRARYFDCRRPGRVVNMGRCSHVQTLHLWAYGDYVGRWTVNANRISELKHDEVWRSSARGRPISLSLPLDIHSAPIRGESVFQYFEGLLPDGDTIRKCMQPDSGLAPLTRLIFWRLSAVTASGLATLA